MKKAILISVIGLLLLCIAILLQECNECDSTPKDTDMYFDMGTGVYHEPFVGIFSNRPSILVWTLDIPPYKYFVDDTLRFSREFNVEFNDESLRYYKQMGKESIIKFSSSEGVRYTPTSINIAATDEKKTFKTTCIIDPSLGDAVTTAKMELCDAAVDEINATQVTTNGYANIKECRAVQRIDKPWILWCLWLLTFLLPIIVIILYFVGRNKN